MTQIALILLFLCLGLVGLAYWQRRQEKQYEEKPTRDALSPAMHALIRQEREENLRKKSAFESALEGAQQPVVPQNTDNDS